MVASSSTSSRYPHKRHPHSHDNIDCFIDCKLSHMLKSIGTTTGTTARSRRVQTRAMIVRLRKRPFQTIGVCFLILSTLYFNLNINQQSSISSSQLRDGTWEWKRFHHRDIDNELNRVNHDIAATTAMRTSSKNRLLISQYDSGTDVLYGNMLNLTSRVNIAYAKKYHFDYVALRGIPFRTALDTTIRKPRPSRATYSKVVLLQKAIELQYDYLLILDSDAMVYDFTRDVSQLLADATPPQQQQQQKMVMAHLVYDIERGRYFDINVGVILFNLHHPRIRQMLWYWDLICRVQIYINVADNDQNPIQRILQIMGAKQLVEGTRQEFAYDQGTVVKHFKRKNAYSWIDPDADNRIQDIQTTTNDVCIKYAPFCNMDDEES